MAVTTTPLSNPLATKLIKDTDSDATAELDVASGALRVYAIEIDNTGNSAITYTKLYNTATVTVGTTVPDFVLATPATTKLTHVLGAPATGYNFATALSLASVTAGGTGGIVSPTSDVTVSIMAS